MENSRDDIIVMYLVKHVQCYVWNVWVNLRGTGHIANWNYVIMNVDAFVMNCVTGYGL